VVWLLLAAFSQTFSENCEQEVEQKDLKTCSLIAKAHVTLELRKAWFPKKKKPRTWAIGKMLQWHLRIWLTPIYLRNKEVKVFISFERLL
jgi:hypothetical protein